MSNRPWLLLTALLLACGSTLKSGVILGGSSMTLTFQEEAAVRWSDMPPDEVANLANQGQGQVTVTYLGSDNQRTLHLLPEAGSLLVPLAGLHGLILQHPAGGSGVVEVRTTPTLLRNLRANVDL